MGNGGNPKSEIVEMLRVMKAYNTLDDNIYLVIL